MVCTDRTQLRRRVGRVGRGPGDVLTRAWGLWSMVVGCICARTLCGKQARTSQGGREEDFGSVCLSVCACDRQGICASMFCVGWIQCVGRHIVLLCTVLCVWLDLCVSWV